MTTYTVTTVQDDADGTPIAGQLTLRDAIAQAQSGDAITFSQGFAAGGAFFTFNTIVLDAPLEIANKSITIQGDVLNQGIEDVAITGGGGNCLLHVDAGATVTLQGVALINGFGGGSSSVGANAIDGNAGANAGSAGGNGGNGQDGTAGGNGTSGGIGAGGIINEGTLTLNNVTLMGLDGIGAGGGSGAQGGFGGQGGQGTGAAQIDDGSTLEFAGAYRPAAPTRSTPR
jgi:hypothetical protein